MTGTLRGAHHEDQQHIQEGTGSRRRRGRRSWGDHGASAVEYALILVAFALGLVVVAAGLQKTVGSALQASADSISGDATPSSCSGDSCDDGDDDGDGGDDDGDDEGGSTPTPTQAAGSTPIAPGDDASFDSDVSSGYTLASPASSACTYSPSVSPSGASISVSEKKSSGTSQSLEFDVSANAAHSQNITATCTFKKGSSSVTRTYKIWIS